MHHVSDSISVQESRVGSICDVADGKCSCFSLPVSPRTSQLESSLSGGFCLVQGVRPRLGLGNTEDLPSIPYAGVLAVGIVLISARDHCLFAIQLYRNPSGCYLLSAANACLWGMHKTLFFLMCSSGGQQFINTGVTHRGQGV